MFLSRKGKLYATVKVHDLNSGDYRIVNHADECTSDVEKSIYNECVSRGEVITMGTFVAEPIA